MQSNLINAQRARQEKILNTLVNYNTVVMTRKEWLKLQCKEGASVRESTKNKLQYNRIKYNRMSSEREQDEYMKKCDEKVVCYELYKDGKTSFWEITKTEYDFFNSLLVEQDGENNLATQENTGIHFGLSKYY